VEQLCALLAADGIPPPDLSSAFGSRDYRHYVVEREGQVSCNVSDDLPFGLLRKLRSGLPSAS